MTGYRTSGNKSIPIRKEANMWPFMIAVGVYWVCKGIQEGINENHKSNLLSNSDLDDDLHKLERIKHEVLTSEFNNSPQYLGSSFRRRK
jgi:hypothetical protein